MILSKNVLRFGVFLESWDGGPSQLRSRHRAPGGWASATLSLMPVADRRGTLT
jgi:hypothetical protein